MCKKTIFLFSSFNFPTKKDQLGFERDVRNDILCQNKEQICLEICYTKKSFFFIDLRNLIKKRPPNLIIFHECDEKTIREHISTIKRLHKKDTIILYTKKPGTEIQFPDGTEITKLKEVSLFLIAISMQN